MNPVPVTPSDALLKLMTQFEISEELRANPPAGVSPQLLEGIKRLQEVVHNYGKGKTAEEKRAFATTLTDTILRKADERAERKEGKEIPIEPDRSLPPDRNQDRTL